MIMNRTRCRLIGAACLCLGLVVAATALLHRGADPGPWEITAWAQHQIAISDQDIGLQATIAILDAVMVEPRHPAAGRWSVAAVAGDGLDMTKRLLNIKQGGRVKSAYSLVTAPASRFSARA